MLTLLLACSWSGCSDPPKKKKKKVVVPPCTTEATFSPARDAEGFDVLWVGDTMIGHAARKVIRKNGVQHTLDGVAPIVRDVDVDYRIFNAEAPFTELQERWHPSMKWHYEVDPTVAPFLAQLGFDAASIGNNHGLDRGPAGIADTKRHLAASGIDVFGNDPVPHWIDTPHGKIAVIGVWGTGWKPFLWRLTPAGASEAVQKARDQGARWVVAYVHWGRNYEDVLPRQRLRAHWLVDAGVDLIVGHGAHVPQELSDRCGVPVAYSLGNFVFHTQGRWTDEQPGYGLVLTTRFGPSGLGPLRFECIRTDNGDVDYRPRVCTAEERAAVFARHDLARFE